jgi:hypothetical protein
MPSRPAWIALLLAAALPGGCGLPAFVSDAAPADQPPAETPVADTPVTNTPLAGTPLAGARAGDRDAGTATAQPLLAAARPAPAGQRALRVMLGPEDGARSAVLLQEQGERRLWRSDGGFALATDGPRIVATSGLPQVLVATRLDGADPLADPVALLHAPGSSRRLVDLATPDRDPAGMRFGLDIACRLHAVPAGDAAQALLMVREVCQGPAPVGGFTNQFLVRAADRAVLRSVQWVGPGLPPVTLEAAAAGPDPLLR